MNIQIQFQVCEFPPHLDPFLMLLGSQYNLGHVDLIEAMQRVKNSFNSYPIDRLAQQAAIASFGDEDYFQLSVDKVIASRKRLVSALENLQFTCLPSVANFILIHHASIDASALASFLRDRRIIVRYFSTPRIERDMGGFRRDPTPESRPPWIPGMSF